MEWRCRSCGKPHEENAPPCDNCGHGRFEKTTVRVTETGGPEQLEWVCTACGRSHPRNSPPCSRCGNTTLERQHLEYDLDDLDGAGYLDLASPRYVVAAAVAVALALVLALGVAGVVDLPAPLGGQPTVSDVPGEADVAANLSLSAVESEYVAAVNERRRALQHDELRRTDALDAAAGYLNRQFVKADYADGRRPSLTGDDLDAFGVRCQGSLTSTRTTLPTTDDGAPGGLAVTSPEALADHLAFSLETDAPVLAGNATSVGVDVHVAPDDTLYTTTILCRE